MPSDGDHELVRASNQLLSEIQQSAPKYAADLFPGGPAGHQVVPKQVERDMVNRHWEEPAFRKQLLDRLSPPGPNGLPGIPEGVDQFLKLYTDAVLRTPTAHPETLSERKAQDSYEVPGYGPGQMRRMERADQKDPTTASVPPPSDSMTPPAAPPAAAPTPLAAAPGVLPTQDAGAPPPQIDPSTLAMLPAGMTPPPGVLP